MIQHAEAVNARLLKVFPKGFALDATHHPHISILQRYVYTANLDNVYAAVGEVLSSEKAAGWSLKAFKYYYIPWKEKDMRRRLSILILGLVFSSNLPLRADSIPGIVDLCTNACTGDCSH